MTMRSAIFKFIGTDRGSAALLAVAASAVMLPALINGIPMGHDLPHHYQCAMTFAESIVEGDPNPSWSLNRNHGFGGMETRLYPPASHFFLAVAYLAIGDWHFASWTVFFALTLIGSLGVYLWARETLPPEHALVAGLIYTILPYHLNQLYNTFFYAEFAGSSVLPYSFLFISRVCRRGRAVDVAGLGAALGLLVLTHLPMSVIASVCFVIYGLSLIDRRRFAEQLLKLAIGAVTGAAASAFFWTKVLAERELMAKALVYEDLWLDYKLNFLLTIVQSYEGFSRDLYENGTYFYDLMLWYTFFMVVSAAIIQFIALRNAGRFTNRGNWVIFLIAVFLAMPFSSFIWARLELLQEVQFPWRWLAIVSVTAPIITASAMPAAIELARTKLRPLVLIAAGFAIAMAAFSVSQIIRPAGYVERESVPAYMAKNQLDIGFTFWWPITVRKEIFDNRERVTATGREVAIDRWTPAERDITLGAGPATSVRIGTFYHPNWRAEFNQTSVPVKSDEFGAILLDIPAGESGKAVLTFHESAATVAGKWLAMFVWPALGLVLFGSLIGRRELEQTQNGESLHSR